MRKSLSRLMMGGLALLSFSSIGYAQTLNQDWKYTEDIPTASNARWGTGFQGKVWTNDKSVPQLIYWDESGKHLMTDASDAALGAAGTGIAVDAVGNIIVSNAFAGAIASTEYKILPVGGNALQSLTVTIPDGAAAGRMDFLGRANGNVLSETGGAFYIATQNSANVSKIFVANGAQVVEKSKSFKGSVVGGTDGICQPVDNNPEGDNFVARPARTQAVFSYYENGEPVLYEVVGSNTTAGGDIVVLNGVTYTIEPNQTAYCDGFQIVDRSNNTVVATHTEEFTTRAAAPNQNALTVEKVDEYTANIYQYVPGQLVAKYTFSLPKPVYLETRNAYAYDIQVAKSDDKVTVSYRLNAPAESATVRVYADGELKKEVAGTVLALYTDESKTDVNNLNTVEIPMTDIPKDAVVSFKVAVVSATVTDPTLAEKTYRFYHPQGVAIDNNPDSPYFGRLYVTECMPQFTATYHSGNAADGQGLYVFDQQLNPVKNANGTYAFKGGQTFPNKFEDGAGSTSYDPRKVRISEDGRVLLSGQNDKGVALWEVNPADLNANFTQVIKGTVDATTYEMKTESGEFIAAPNVGMAVRGEGADLKVLMLSANKTGMGYAYSGYRTDEYNLGTATEWTVAPSKSIPALTGQYTISPTNTNVLYDNEGGIWYVNSRSTATDAEPVLVHVNAEGVEDYKEGAGANRYGGGGIAFNKDFTRLAIASTGSTITVYTVSKSAEGAPVLTEEYNFATTIGRNCNDIAWDVADNLYIVGNSGEWLKSFSLPRANGEVEVAAASKYDMKISSDEYPATLYVIGTMNNWDPTDGSLRLEKGENGVYTGEITTSAASDNFAIISELSSDWDNVVNVNRWGFAEDNAIAKINEPNTIVKGTGAIQVGVIGTYKVTVDLKNMTLLLEGDAPEPDVYPEVLYMLGTIDPENAWDVTDGSVRLEKDADKAIYRVKEAVIYEAAEGYGYVTFASVLGTTSDDWTTVNANRYGPAVADTELANEVTSEIAKTTNNSYKIKSGKYDIVVNLEEGTILVSEVEAGVESVESSVKVIAGRGVIRVEGEVESTSVYNMNGQAVVLESPDKEFNVAAGVYIVVTDGRSTKVLVK